MLSSHPALVWPRSDGSPNRWPIAQERKVALTEPWFELLPQSDKKWALYRSKIVEHLADYFRIPGDNESTIYRTLLTRKIRSIRSTCQMRTDVYLYVSLASWPPIDMIQGSVKASKVCLLYVVMNELTRTVSKHAGVSRTCRLALRHFQKHQRPHWLRMQVQLGQRDRASQAVIFLRRRSIQAFQLLSRQEWEATED